MKYCDFDSNKYPVLYYEYRTAYYKDRTGYYKYSPDILRIPYSML
jgi:hypothetical protein